MWKRTTVFKGHTSPVYALCNDGKYYYSSAGDKFVTRWCIATGKQDPFTVLLDVPAYSILVAQNLLFIGCTNGTICCVDVVSKQMIWERNYYGHAIFSLVVDESQEILLFGDLESNLVACDFSGEKLFSFPLSAGKIRALHLYDTQLWVGTQAGIIFQLELPTYNEVSQFKFHNGSVNSLLFLPESDILISGGHDGHIVLTDTKAWIKLKRFPAHYQTIYDLKRLNHCIVSCSLDKTIKLWNQQDWFVLQRIELNVGHKRSVNALSTISGEEFVSASDDKCIMHWAWLED